MMSSDSLPLAPVLWFDPVDIEPGNTPDHDAMSVLAYGGVTADQASQLWQLDDAYLVDAARCGLFPPWLADWNLESNQWEFNGSCAAGDHVEHAVAEKKFWLPLADPKQVSDPTFGWIKMNEHRWRATIARRVLVAWTIEAQPDWSCSNRNFFAWWCSHSDNPKYANVSERWEVVSGWYKSATTWVNNHIDNPTLDTRVAVIDTNTLQK